MSCNTTLTTITLIEPFTGWHTDSAGIDRYIEGVHIVANAVDYYLNVRSMSEKSGVFYINSDCCCYSFSYTDTPYTIAELDGMFIIRWTTATRPASPFVGQQGYNTETNVYEYWNGTIWIQL